MSVPWSRFVWKVCEHKQGDRSVLDYAGSSKTRIFLLSVTYSGWLISFLTIFPCVYFSSLYWKSYHTYGINIAYVFTNLETAPYLDFVQSNPSVHLSSSNVTLSTEKMQIGSAQISCWIPIQCQCWQESTPSCSIQNNKFLLSVKLCGPWIKTKMLIRVYTVCTFISPYT